MDVLEVRGARTEQTNLFPDARTNKQGGQLLRLNMLKSPPTGRQKKQVAFALGQTFDIGTSPCR